MRLPPLPGEEWDDRTRAALAGLVPRGRQDPEGAGAAVSTLVRHPDLATAFFAFSTYLLARSTLPARLASWRSCGSPGAEAACTSGSTTCGSPPISA